MAGKQDCEFHNRSSCQPLVLRWGFWICFCLCVRFLRIPAKSRPYCLQSFTVGFREIDTHDYFVNITEKIDSWYSNTSGGKVHNLRSDSTVRCEVHNPHWAKTSEAGLISMVNPSPEIRVVVIKKKKVSWLTDRHWWHWQSTRSWILIDYIP